MTRPLIASLVSTSGRYTAKIYRNPKTAGYLTVCYVDGVAHRDSDMTTETEAEARAEAAVSLCVCEELNATATQVPALQ